MRLLTAEIEASPSPAALVADHFSGGSAMQKPSREEVLRYAKPQVLKFIHQLAGDLPHEQKEEIEQTAYVRLLEAYAELDAAAGWKSYVYNHCRGAVLDYLKFGKGFQEDKWSIAKQEEHGSRHVGKIRERVSMQGPEDSEIDIDAVLGMHRVFTEIDQDSPTIQWTLLARMASTDPALHAFLKWLRGFQIEELGPILGISRARVGQLIVEFVARFDDPEWAMSPWFCQTVWALGLARRFGVEDRDQSELAGYSIGWNLKPVDLDSSDVKPIPRSYQMSLF